MNTEIFINKTLIIVLIISVILILVFGFLGYQYGFKRGLNAKQEIVDKYNNEDPINNPAGNTNSVNNQSGIHTPPSPFDPASQETMPSPPLNYQTNQEPHIPPAPFNE
ncbi:MAG: hypothetical protein ABH884_02780 [Candidatus Komeilibacteria bacterium]